MNYFSGIEIKLNTKKIFLSLLLNYYEIVHSPLIIIIYNILNSSISAWIHAIHIEFKK